MIGAGEFLQEDNGRFSSVRLAFLVWTVFFCIAILVSAVFQRALPPIPQEYLFLTGIFAGSKVLQKFGENGVKNGK